MFVIVIIIIVFFFCSFLCSLCEAEDINGLCNCRVIQHTTRTSELTSGTANELNESYSGAEYSHIHITILPRILKPLQTETVKQRAKRIHYSISYICLSGLNLSSSLCLLRVSCTILSKPKAKSPEILLNGIIKRCSFFYFFFSRTHQVFNKLLEFEL